MHTPYTVRNQIQSYELLVDRGLLLRLGRPLLSAGRRTPSAHLRDHAPLRSEVEVRGRQQPLQLWQPRTRALFRGP
jgi:hypothetical protein